MLVKVSTDTITATDTDNTQVFYDNTQVICYYNGNNPVYERGSLWNVDIDKNWIYNVSMNVTSWWWGGGGSQRIYLDSRLAVSSTDKTTWLKEDSITLSKGTYDVNYVLYTLGNNTSKVNSAIKWVTITRTSFVLVKNGTNWIPKGLQTIGDNGFIIIFGIVEWEFYKEELEKAVIYSDTSSECSTGSITLWQAVGFVVIQVGSKKFKIPYYWD